MSVWPATVETIVRFRLAGAASLRAGADEIAQWRKQPVEVGAEKLPPSFLRNSEDQTVLALQCVLRVQVQHGWRARDFADWGVITAANFIGRGGIAHTVQRFQQEGPWGVSPHSIPHQSLHAPAGTVSQALHIHGPNFGVGGGPNSAPDAFLLAAALLTDRLPGLWVVLTGHETEYVPERAGRPIVEPPCLAVALALTTPDGNEDAPHLSIGHASANSGDPLDVLPEFHLDLLAHELACTEIRPTARWRLSSSHWLEIDSAAAEGRHDA